jgi:hydrolase family protein
MPEYPQLVHLSLPELVGAAGGDPWRVDETVQAGSPGEISELATSFRNAGVCMTETDEEFNAAKKRFDAAWDRDDPAHPINDAEEVRRATAWLKLGKEQMAKVSADLQNIAATLAEAQRSGHISIGNLNNRLVQIDNVIAAEIAKAQADGVQLDWSALKNAAMDATKSSLGEVTAVRTAYGTKLSEAELDMAADGYDTDAIRGGEGRGEQSAQDQAGYTAQRYDETQRAADEALVNSGGPMTPEKQAAAARLRDFGIVNDPNANPYAKQYAGERLSDYNMSRFVGPLPVDPILGTDARQQAKVRLDYQQKLEAGLFGTAMSPDAATAFLDSCDTQAQAIALNRIEHQLRNIGVSDNGIAKLIQGMGWLSDSIGTGVGQYGKSVETGEHALNGLSKVDAELLSKWGGRVGWAGNIAQLAVALNEWSGGGMNRNEELGEAVGGVGGSILGGMATGAAVGSYGGPYTAAAAAVIGGLLGGFAGSDIGGRFGSLFDPRLTSSAGGGGGGSW